MQRQALLDDGLTTKNILPSESLCHSMSDAIFFTKTGIIALGGYKEKSICKYKKQTAKGTSKCNKGNFAKQEFKQAAITTI